ncbi:MAG: DUF4252 domain-containing protein [Candidatus Helarchaeota archaeon]|nr:DUF4252 domain-containing protein [Candidatus Helarchaeota archaeon]
MRKSLAVLWVSGIFILLCSGCMTSNDFNYVEKSIENEIYPATMKTNFKLSLGPVMLSPLKTIVNLTDRKDKASPYLDEISNVQFGVYKIDKTNKSPKLKIPPIVEEKLNKSGWEIFIRVREKNEMVEFYYRQISKDIIGIYAIVLNADNLVIAEMRGRLARIIEKAVQEHGFPLKDIF